MTPTPPTPGPYDYRPAPELVRAHEQLTQALRAELSKAQSSANLRGTEVMMRLLPILDGVLGFATGVQGDLAMYAQQLVGEAEADTLVGLDEETYEDLDVQLKQALASLTEVAAELENGAKPKVRSAMENIANVRAALSELVLDEGIEGEEPLDEEGDDDALDLED